MRVLSVSMGYTRKSTIRTAKAPDYLMFILLVLWLVVDCWVWTYQPDIGVGIVHDASSTSIETGIESMFIGNTR